MSEGGESGLQELNAKIDEFSKEIAKKKEQRNNLEQRKNQLMKQVTNAEVECTAVVTTTRVCGLCVGTVAAASRA